MKIELNGIETFEFQEKAYTSIIKALSIDKDYIQLKAPTGAGKTIILISAIDCFYNEHINDNSSFIWFCPGAGELEEQSLEKMQKYSGIKSSDAQNLQSALLNGFDKGSITFINWESVNNTDKRLALQDGEKKNLYDRIAEAHRDNRTFYIIIDEAHRDDTLNAKTIIDSFKAKSIIEASATIIWKDNAEKVIIPDEVVIEEGLIVKEIVVNEGLEKSNGDYFEDDKKLIDISLSKYSEILSEYQKLGVPINPLIIVQFPDKGIKNVGDERVNNVIKYLEEKGYSTNNKTVAVWFSGIKQNLTNITDDNSPVSILLMKQAIATGWDCPRAKVLAKIRTNMKDTFEIQTIGRIRRMAEHKHYGNNILDYCYVYTYDDNFTEELFKTEKSAVSKRLLHLKDEGKSFLLEKEIKSSTFINNDARLMIDKFANKFVEIYNLKFGDYKESINILKSQSFEFTDKIKKDMLIGRIRTLEISDINSLKGIDIEISASSNEAKLYYMKAYSKIAQILDIEEKTANVLLRKIFFVGKKYDKKILNLSVDDFYGFIITNIDKLIEVSSKIVFEHSRKNSELRPPLVDFKFLHSDRLKYDIDSRNTRIYNKFIYSDYTHEFTTRRTRSLAERHLETFLENSNKVEWFYKNGDSGENYFSVVYLPSEYSNKEKLFFPDYIVKLTDGVIWLIEAKGGENADGEDQNIDKMIVSKFDALKRYVEQQKEKGNINLNFAFVRYNAADELLFNNKGEVDDLDSPNWLFIENIFE